MAIQAAHPITQVTRSMQALQESVVRIKDVQALDSSEATKNARKLYLSLQNYQQHLLTNEEGIEELSKQRIPMPIALKLVELLSSQELQFEDNLKRYLSKVASSFIQLIVFQCAAQQRRTYRESVEYLSGRIEIALSTLPAKEIEAELALKCSQAALRNLEPGRGRWKEVAADHALSFTEGLFVAALSRNPAGLVGPALRLTIRVYQELGIGSSWYQRIWPFSWGKTINTIEEFETLEKYVVDSKGKSRLYIALSQVMHDILARDDSSSELKDRVLTANDGLSVFRLATQFPGMAKKIKWGWTDKLWKTRYLSITTMGMVVRSSSPHKVLSSNRIVASVYTETDPLVSRHIQTTLESFWSELPVAVENERPAVVAALNTNQEERASSQRKYNEISDSMHDAEERLELASENVQTCKTYLRGGRPQSADGNAEEEEIVAEMERSQSESAQLTKELEQLSTKKQQEEHRLAELQVQQKNLEFLQNLLNRSPHGHV